MAAKLTLGSTDGYLPQAIFKAGELPAYLQGQPFSLGVFIKTSTALLAKAGLYDGVDSSFTSVHGGGGGWQWLTVTRTLDAAATELELRLQVDIAGSAGNATFDLPTVIPGPIPPQLPLPCPAKEGTIIHQIRQAVSVGTDLFRFRSGRPYVVRNTSLAIKTAPTGSALIVDVNKWDGAAWQSMFTTKPQIAISATEGGAEPDGTYENRCIGEGNNTDARTDRELNIDVDQIGSTVGGSDLNIYVRTIQFESPARALGSF
jgi:hypothetical protein